MMYSIADVAIRQEEIIEGHKITDWENNHDVKQQIKSELDETFYEVERLSGVEFATDELDLMLDRVMEVAKARTRSS